MDHFAPPGHPLTRTLFARLRATPAQLPDDRTATVMAAMLTVVSNHPAHHLGPQLLQDMHRLGLEGQWGHLYDAVSRPPAAQAAAEPLLNPQEDRTVGVLRCLSGLYNEGATHTAANLPQRLASRLEQRPSSAQHAVLRAATRTAMDECPWPELHTGVAPSPRQILVLDRVSDHLVERGDNQQLALTHVNIMEHPDNSVPRLFACAWADDLLPRLRRQPIHPRAVEPDPLTGLPGPALSHDALDPLTAPVRIELRLQALNPAPALPPP